MVNNKSLLQQEATPIILKNVSQYCAKCYQEFKESDTLYYDMQEYCYLCKECAKKRQQKLNDICKSIEVDREDTLF